MKLITAFAARATAVFCAFTLLAACGGGGGGGGGTNGITPITPTLKTPEFAYVADSFDNAISAYVIDNVTGRFRFRDKIATSTACATPKPGFVALHPSGKYAYVLNRCMGTPAVVGEIAQYSIGADGLLTPLATATVATGYMPVSMAIDPSGQYAYVANNGTGATGTATVRQYTIDPVTGSLSPMTPAWVETTLFTQPASVVVHPGGKYVYVADGSGNVVFQLSIGAGGALALMSTATVTAGMGTNSVTVDPTGRYVYAANTGSDSVSQYAVKTDGSLNRLGEIATGSTGPLSVTTDAAGKYVYASNASGTTISQYSIGAGGALTAMTPATVAVEGSGMVVATDPSGKFAFVGSNNGYILQYTIGASGVLAQNNMYRAAATRVPEHIAILGGSTAVPVGPRYVYSANYGSADVSANTVSQATGGLTQIDADPATGGVQNFAAGTWPYEVATDPFGKHVYVVNQNSSTISAYSASPATGALTRIDADAATAGVQDFATGSGPTGVAVDPLGRFVYVANYSASTVSVFTRDAVTGALTRVDADAATAGVQDFAAGTQPVSIAVDPTGRFVYTANLNANTVTAFTVNAGSGALTRVDADAATAGVQDFAAGTKPNGVRVDPTGRFVYVANSGGDVSAYSIDTVAGSATRGALTSIDADAATAGIQNFPASGGSAYSVAFEPSGKYVYVSAGSSIAAYSIDAATGALSQIDCGGAAGTGCDASDTKNFEAGTVPFGQTSKPRGMAVDESGKYLYLANETLGILVYSLDSATGKLTAVDASAGTAGVQGFPAGTAPKSVAIISAMAIN